MELVSTLLLCLLIYGFFGVGSDGLSVLVKEGDSVTLNTDVITNQQYRIRWYFNRNRIAEITAYLSKICNVTDVQCKERFRDRLKLDHQTGSLTITNITNTDSGEYQLEINNSILRIFSVTVYGFFGVGSDGLSVSAMEGDSVTLHTDVKINQQYIIRWYFNGTLIAEITAYLSKICTDVQCKERFRDRLKLDHQTGSLTITNIKNTDSGDYQLEIIVKKHFSVSVHDVPANKRDEVKRMSAKEGESVTFERDVIRHPNDVMTWYFNDIFIAEITGEQSQICTDVQCKERFRDRLKLDHQTGSLTITDIRNTDTGFDQLKISKRRISIIRSFSVSVTDEVLVSVMEGDTVTLNTSVQTNQQEEIKWYFNDILIAEITGDHSKICTDVQCKERYRDRLKLDHQTGSLTITNTRTTDSGVYQLKINSRRFNIIKSFSVSFASFFGVDKDELSVMEDDSVTLHTDVKIDSQEEITWFQNDIIAQINGDQTFICTDVQCDDSNERFRDRLKLDHQTGSLTITNITNTDSGEYKLQIINQKISEILKNIIVTVTDVSAAERDKMKRKYVKEGQSVTLDSCVIKNPNDVMTCHVNHTRIAEITRDQSKICTDDECKERFRDRLELDYQTGSLTITNTRIADSGEYKLQINSSSSISFSIDRSFSVNVTADLTIYAAVAVVLLLVVAAAVLIYSCKCQSRRINTRMQHNDQVNGVEDSFLNQNDTQETNTPDGMSHNQSDASDIST